MTTRPEGQDPAYDATRVRLGAAVRRLGHAVVRHEADIDTMDEVIESIDSLVEHLAAHPSRVRNHEDFKAARTGADAPDQMPMQSHIARPGSGPGSPHGLEMTVHRRGNRIEAAFHVGHSHEGAPGRSHGGFVALAFDDAMGFVLVLEKVVAFTGELTIRYKAATPLNTPLVIEAWLSRREGRKLYMEAELREHRPDAPLIATATALFIEPNF